MNWKYSKYLYRFSIFFLLGKTHRNKNQYLSEIYDVICFTSFLHSESTRLWVHRKVFNVITEALKCKIAVDVIFLSRVSKTDKLERTFQQKKTTLVFSYYMYKWTSVEPRIINKHRIIEERVRHKYLGTNNTQVSKGTSEFNVRRYNDQFILSFFMKIVLSINIKWMCFPIYCFSTSDDAVSWYHVIVKNR